MFWAVFWALRRLWSNGSNGLCLAAKRRDGFHDAEARGIDPLIRNATKCIEATRELISPDQKRIELAISMCRGVGTERGEDGVELVNGATRDGLKCRPRQRDIEPSAVDGSTEGIGLVGDRAARGVEDGHRNRAQAIRASLQRPTSAPKSRQRILEGGGGCRIGPNGFALEPGDLSVNLSRLQKDIRAEALDIGL